VSLPAGMIQLELFADQGDYEWNPNPMVRTYGLTWNAAKCGVTTNKPKAHPCLHFDPVTKRCVMRRGIHDSNWDACGKYRPMQAGSHRKRVSDL
jgi:hypothetical protein